MSTLTLTLTLASSRGENGSNREGSGSARPGTNFGVAKRLSKKDDAKVGARARGRERVRVSGGNDAHVSVMTAEVLEALSPQKGDIVVDMTAGAGGHSEALLHAGAQVVALDADPGAVHAVRARLAPFGARAQVLESNFADVSQALRHAQVGKVNGALLDLGWNRTQLASGRGFSFMHDEPLNMSYGSQPRSGFTAAQILNTWDENVLADVFFGYGEERYARRIAKRVVEAREDAPIETTHQFVEIIRSAVPAVYARGRLHFATRSFQALRIAVNDELRVLEAGLHDAWSTLAEGGRMAVISFHSIEDRVVKQFFAARVKESAAQLLFKKPRTPSPEELAANPASRSAKLRAATKTL